MEQSNLKQTNKKISKGLIFRIYLVCNLRLHIILSLRRKFNLIKTYSEAFFSSFTKNIAGGILAIYHRKSGAISDKARDYTLAWF